VILSGKTGRPLIHDEVGSVAGAMKCRKVSRAKARMSTAATAAMPVQRTVCLHKDTFAIVGLIVTLPVIVSQMIG